MRTPTCIYADSKYSIKRHGGVIKCNAAKVYLAAYSYGEEKMESLFDISDESNAYAPLADRMRPEILDDIIGQDESVGKNSFLYKMIERDTVPSLLLFGPPGCGKTTIASVIAKMTKFKFLKLNATSSGAKEIRDIVPAAQKELQYYGRRTIVFIDEVHRFNRAQQDLLLPYVENGTFILIGATTENPYFELNGSLLSRIRLIHLKPLSIDSIVLILQKALTDKNKGLGMHDYHADEIVLKNIAAYAAGDTRIALNLLEQATTSLPYGGVLTEKDVQGVAGEQMSVYDKKGDYHYDIASAFIKSMRGSDPQAALHYLARMIAGGEKTSFISRRIIICAAEDVGLADPDALRVAVSAAQAAEMVGFPEAQIILAEAVLYISLAPKSNSTVVGISAAMTDIAKKSNWSIPRHLKDAHYNGANRLGYGIAYKYPHAYGGWVKQQYLPDELCSAVYYRPVLNGAEAEIVKRWNKRMNKE